MRVRNGPTHLGIIWPNPKFGLTRTDFKKEAGAAVAASQRMKTCIHLTVGYKLHFSPVIQSDLLIGPQIYHRIILLNRCHYSAGNSYRAGNLAHSHRHAEHYLQKSALTAAELIYNPPTGAKRDVWCAADVMLSCARKSYFLLRWAIPALLHVLTQRQSLSRHFTGNQCSFLKEMLVVKHNTLYRPW